MNQMFFEGQIIPEEMDELYYLEQAPEFQILPPRSPVDEFGLPLRVDIKNIPVKPNVLDAPVVMTAPP